MSAAECDSSSVQQPVLREGRDAAEEEEELQATYCQTQPLEAAADPEASASMQRLDELLQLTEMRVAQSKKLDAQKKDRASSAAAASGGRSHGLLTEEEEDENIIQDEMRDDEPQWPTHFEQQPSCIEFGEMRDYQIEALNWMIGLHDAGLNGILADEMGLGKTLQSISVLGYLKQFRSISEPHIVLVPKSTLGNWCREFARWCPSLNVIRFHGTKEERIDLREQLKTDTSFDVVVTTYEMVIREKSFLSKISFHYMLIDEAHRIKNENSLLSQVIRTYKTRHRLLVTGTPLQNNLHELWALLNFLMPDLFSSSGDFNRWFDLANSEDSQAIVKRLHKVLRPFLLRRLKTDVETSLKPKIETMLYVGLSKMQREWYTKLLTRDIDAINSTTGSKVRLLNILMQLRKTTNHPYLFHGAEPGPPFIEGEHIIENSGKMVLLDKLLSKLKANGSRVLIFSQMTRMLDILEDYFRLRGHAYCRIDGQTGQDSREEQMDVFNAEGSSKFAFLLSTRAGGLGINLQTADTVILYDSDWNPQMDLQAQDRAHRIGQKKQVHVYRLVTHDTVEEKIVERAYKKLFLDAVVIQQGRLAQKNKLEKSELSSMVRFGADQIFSAKESMITDDDIDLILSRGEKKTKEMTATLKKDAAFSVSSFSLQDQQETSLYDFEGKDFKDIKRPTLLEDDFHFVAMPKRERKENYDVDGYYRSAMSNGPARAKTNVERIYKPSVRHDFQFFNVKRIHELEKKDFESKKLLRIWTREQREKEKDDKRKEKEMLQKKKRELAELNRQKQTASGSENPEVEADASQEQAGPGPVPEEQEAPGEEQEVPEEDQEALLEPGSNELVETNTPRRSGRAKPSAAVIQQERERGESEEERREKELRAMEKKAGCLTASEQKELQRLEEAGFGDWIRRDFHQFIRASEICGRDALEEIVEHISGKTTEQVRRYHLAFWKQYKHVKGYRRYIAQIERGESRIKRRQEITRIVDAKLKLHKDPFKTLALRYSGGRSQRNGYTPEEDRFLFCTMAQLGFGNWDELRMEVRRSWLFRFDWFIKSKTAQELGRRCESLVKLAESELEDRKASRKRKGVSTSTVSPSKRSKKLTSAKKRARR